MKIKDYPRYTIRMSRNQAIKLRILWCECGHPAQLHFDSNKGKHMGGCAKAHDGSLDSCGCTEYEETIILPKDDEQC